MGAKSLCAICQRPMWYPVTSGGAPVPGRVQHRAAGECFECRPARIRPSRACLDCGNPTSGERCRPCHNKSRRVAERPLCEHGDGRVVERAGTTLCRQHADQARRTAKAEAARAKLASSPDLSKADEVTITARALAGGTPHLTAEERAEAACRNTDVDSWYHTGDTSAALAKSCASCPLRARCLEVAIAYREHGYWAGTTEDDRKALMRRARRVAETEAAA